MTNDILQFINFLKSNASNRTSWCASAEQEFGNLLSSAVRYNKVGADEIKVRVSSATKPNSLLWAAYLNPANVDGGAYGGTSLVVFASKNRPSLLTFCVGTQGLAPDEKILGNPGHARKLAAICKYLNKVYGNGTQVAWAKDNPCKTDVLMPANVVSCLNPETDDDYAMAFKARDKGGYGKEIYAIVNIDSLIKRATELKNAHKKDANDREIDPNTAVEEAVCMFLDLFFKEYGIGIKVASREDAKELMRKYQAMMMPDVSVDDLKNLLNERRYVIVEGPPGTGKSTAAQDLYKEYDEHITVQFHPNMTYEQFIGGLMPMPDKPKEGEDEDIAWSGGFKFVPVRGYLLEAVAKAKEGKKTLLHIDEINRADLARVLGEAIYLFEPYAKNQPEVTLSYDFAGFPDRKLSLPPNLHVIGTMNSADRSIAILDIAIRRRFCFERLYPQMSVVEKHGDDLGKRAFSELIDIFINNASDESFKYIPGHSYFLKRPGCAGTEVQIRTELIPLLREYIEQGFVSGFEDHIRAYIEQYEITCARHK